MPKKQKKVRVPISNKGSLTKFGYRMRNNQNERHLSLMLAINEYGVDEVIKKITALKVFNKNRPDLYRIAENDLKFVQNF